MRRGVKVIPPTKLNKSPLFIGFWISNSIISFLFLMMLFALALGPLFWPLFW